MINSNSQLFREQGYIILPAWFDQQEVDQLRELCDQTPPAIGETFEDGQYVSPDQLGDRTYMHYWSQSVRSHPLDAQIVDPRIQALIEELFPGEEYLRYGSDFKVTMPGSTYFYPHFDTPYRYDYYSNDFDERTLGMQFAIALDDFSETNGATRFLPGSHRRVMHKADIMSGQYHSELKDNGTSFVGPAGSLLLYHSRTLHSTMPNRSSSPRRLMLSLTLHRSILEKLRDLEQTNTG